MKILDTLKEKLTGRCPKCNSSRLVIREEGHNYTEGENFPSGCFYADWAVTNTTRTKYCEDCDYSRVISEKETRVQVS